ncbi:NAD-dependent epimerase/dehydratase family protein [Clostridium intestinale]|uniref:NAD-dependent epimerase/dehydratase family protein n=1 Tax=Clostridium intestinale TaxID=36845 RepID=UPI0028E18DA7|nr:NAD-dependent epimerase/dehydratase family protein [Clostridium intestinale]
MKNILITGANSYIGTSFEKWLEKYPDKYNIDTVDMKYESWKEKDFSVYDVVFHVAGIAHIKETKENTELYYKINRDLAYEAAKKAKADGVKHFIFLSSMSVYGIETGCINEETIPNPKSNYGKSKLQAEELILGLQDDKFKLAILRPPMIYGKGCRGNYPKLAKLATKSPIFPNIENKRSMLYIDNLCEFVRVLINDSMSGLFLPQNDEYVCTSDMVKLIANTHGKNIYMTKIFNPILRLLNIGVVNKVFGDLLYVKENDISNIISFRKSIEFTENLL